MKKLTILCAICMMILTSISAKAQPDLYKKYANIPGITKVYISPSMMKLVGAAAVSESMGEMDVEVEQLILKMREMYLISTEDSKVSIDLKNDFDSKIKNKNVELLMEVADGDDNIHIYSESKDNLVNSLYFFITDSSETVMIIFTGDLKPDDLAKIIK